jgi:hypothetical protein
VNSRLVRPVFSGLRAGALAFLLLAAPAWAEDAPLKPTAQADAAWINGDLDGAVPLYESALEAGGLAPAEVVTAYARIGTYRAAMGKSDAALSAFRLAAAIDPEFRLPDESGPKAEALYTRARKEAGELGAKLEIKAGMPDEVTAGRSFVVIAKLPEGFAPLVDRVGIEVHDKLAKINWKGEKAADPSVRFDVPGKVAVTGATLIVTVAALDRHGNRYAVSEQRVKVAGRPLAAIVPETPLARNEDPFADEKDARDAEKDENKKGFWASPWPWAIGGAIVLGAAVGTFAATRSPDQATVGAPQWR